MVFWSGGRAGTRRPTITPASVACTPEACTANQSAIPAITYGASCHTLSHRSMTIPTTIPAASASAAMSTSSV